jgi:hypothetical protein
MGGVSGMMHCSFVSVAAVVPVEFFGIAVVLLGILVWVAVKLGGEWRRAQKPLYETIEKSHPVLGSYSDHFTHWTASVAAGEGVDGTLGISAQGCDPTALQLQKLEEIRGRLPGILTRLAPFVSGPRQDDSGHLLDGFHLTEAKLLHLAVGEDGGFHVRVGPAECPEFRLKLLLEVDEQEKLTYYTWVVPEGFPWEGHADADDHEGPQWSLKEPEHYFGEDVQVRGPGEAPTQEQLRKVAEIAARLPDLLKDLAPLVGASDSDAEKRLQAFDLAAARVLQVDLSKHGAFSLTLYDRGEREGWQYWITLEMEIDRDWKMVEYQWAL